VNSNSGNVRRPDEYQKENRSLQCRLLNVVIHDMHKADVPSEAKEHGVKSVPAVVIDGTLAR
jgi:hypothetical protein